MKKSEKREFIIQTLENLYPIVEIPLDHINDFTFLIAVMLSAQSTDKKVNEITPDLFSLAPNPEKMVDLGIPKIKNLIRQIGLAPTKAKNIFMTSTNNFQQADTGTKMVHLGENSKSTIIAKGICAGKSNGSYRGLVKIAKGAKNSRNFSQCDSLLMGDKCGSHTFPYIEVDNKSSQVEHEATTSKIGEDQIFYCNQRGIGTEEAVALIVNGYCKEVLNKLPMEFAVEAKKLLEISLEGSVG